MDQLHPCRKCQTKNNRDCVRCPNCGALHPRYPASAWFPAFGIMGLGAILLIVAIIDRSSNMDNPARPPREISRAVAEVAQTATIDTGPATIDALPTTDTLPETIYPWPFDATAVTLNCRTPVGRMAGMVTVTTPAGVEYAVNGTAKRDYPDMRPIWLRDPARAGLKVNVGPAIQRGLALCLGPGEAAPSVLLRPGSAPQSAEYAASTSSAAPPAAVASDSAMACESSTHRADRRLMARAKQAALADARPFAHGRAIRSHEAWVSAEYPNVACGSVWFDAEGGKLSYAVIDGAVFGRWREIDNAERGIPNNPSSPLAQIRQICRFDWRTCENPD